MFTDEGLGMNLWLLRPAKGLKENDDPWGPGHNRAFGFVVRAETEQAARALAHADAGDENRGTNQPWMDAEYSTCVVLLPEGAAGVVMSDLSD